MSVMHIMALGFGLLAGAAALAPREASAQPAPPTRVRGAIESFDGAILRVKSREGADLAIRLADNARVAALRNAGLDEVKSGSFVGIAAMPRPDGTQMALEVLIFPEAMRGTGEGHRAWDLLPESTMTNATVSDTVAKAEGRTLTLTYKEGQKTFVVPREAPIVTFIPADRSDLKPGAKVFTSVTRGADGSLSAASVTVGKDGVDPPM